MWSQDRVRTVLKYLWILSFVFLVWQSLSSYPKLPERLATHFDASGNLDGWSSRRGFFIGWYALILGMNAIWLLSVTLIPRSLRGRFARSINIPNRDYWLATDERKAECARRMNTMMFGISFLTNVMWGIIHHSIIQSSIETRIHLSITAIWVIMGALLVFTFAYLFTAFRKPKASTTDQKEE